MTLFNQTPKVGPELVAPITYEKLVKARDFMRNHPVPSEVKSYGEYLIGLAELLDRMEDGVNEMSVALRSCARTNR